MEPREPRLSQQQAQGEPDEDSSGSSPEKKMQRGEYKSPRATAVTSLTGAESSESEALSCLQGTNCDKTMRIKTITLASSQACNWNRRACRRRCFPPLAAGRRQKTGNHPRPRSMFLTIKSESSKPPCIMKNQRNERYKQEILLLIEKCLCTKLFKSGLL